jgi:hypothetical protein
MAREMLGEQAKIKLECRARRVPDHRLDGLAAIERAGVLRLCAVAPDLRDQQRKAQCRNAHNACHCNLPAVTKDCNDARSEDGRQAV